MFNEISLERDFMLWQSSDDGLTEKRIRFLSQFRETRFDPQLGLERNQLAKNLILANAFYDKGKGPWPSKTSPIHGEFIFSDVF